MFHVPCLTSVSPEGSVVTQYVVCWLVVGVGWLVLLAQFGSPVFQSFLLHVQGQKHFSTGGRYRSDTDTNVGIDTNDFRSIRPPLFSPLSLWSGDSGAEMRLLSYPRVTARHTDRDRIPKGNAWNSTRCVVAREHTPRHKVTCSDRKSGGLLQRAAPCVSGVLVHHDADVQRDMW